MLSILILPIVAGAIMLALGPILPVDFLGRNVGFGEAWNSTFDLRVVQMRCYQQRGEFELTDRLSSCMDASNWKGPLSKGSNVEVSLSSDLQSYWAVASSSNGRFQCSFLVDRDSGLANPMDTGSWPLEANGRNVCRRSNWPYSMLHGFGIGIWESPDLPKPMKRLIAMTEEAVARGVLPVDGTVDNLYVAQNSVDGEEAPLAAFRGNLVGYNRSRRAPELEAIIALTDSIRQGGMH
jgi:hypothetical protein